MENTRTAVIVDMDGTMVNVDSIVHHLLNNKRRDFDRFHRESAHCPPNQKALDFCDRAVADGHAVVIVTARTYAYQEVTIEWLSRHLVHPYDGPYMRGDGDTRPDVEVKREIHRILTEDHGYRIVGAIDDNPPIIDLWTSLGIPVEVVERDWDSWKSRNNEGAEA